MSYIRSTHVAGVRSGQWATLDGVDVINREGNPRCPVFRVSFVDGVVDTWPVYDPSDPYEFRMTL